MWSNFTNSHFAKVTPQVNDSLDDLYKEIDKIHIPRLDNIESHSHTTIWVIVGVSASILILCILYIILRLYFMRVRNTQFGNLGEMFALETARRLAEVISTQNPENHNINQTD